MKNFLCVLLSLSVLFSCKKNKDIKDTGPDNQPKLYVQGGPPGAQWDEIFSVNLDGSGLKQLTDISGGGVRNTETNEPILSADGKKIFFTSSRDFVGGEIFSMDPDGSNITKIISNNIQKAAIFGASFYQNGQKLVYCVELDSFANRHGELYTADITGNNIQNLTTAADGSCYYPCVNPANTTILYTNLMNNEIQIYAMDINGANKHPLTTGFPNNKFRPQFSPDGTKVVFDGTVGPAFEIFIMDADGSHMKQLTNYSNNGTMPAYTFGPSFSKDGTTIYFTSSEFDGNKSQLYKMNVDGTGKTKLTSSILSFYNPCAY